MINIACVITYAVNIYHIATHSKKAGKSGSAAASLMIVLFFLSLVLTWVTNGCIESESPIRTGSVIVLTAAAYIAAVLALINKFAFIKRLNLNNLAGADNLEPSVKTCRNCGKNYDFDSPKSPYCGTQSEALHSSGEEIVRCAECAAEVQEDALFCGKCGASLE